MRKSHYISVLIFALSVPHAVVSQQSKLLVRPDAVDAGSVQTVEYRFVPVNNGLSRGGGLRIEIPVAYAESEFLLWSKPQTESSNQLGFVRAIASNGASIAIRVHGVLGGIVEATVARGELRTGDTLTIEYYGKVQSLAADVPGRYAVRGSASVPWEKAGNPPSIRIRPHTASTLIVKHLSDLTRGKPFDFSIVALDQFGNVAESYAADLAVTSTDSRAIVPARVRISPSDSGRITVSGAAFNTTGFQKIIVTGAGVGVKIAYRYAWIAETPSARNHFFGDTHFHTGTGAGNQGFFTLDSNADLNTIGTDTFKNLNLAGDHRANFTTATSAFRYARETVGLDFAGFAEHATPLLTDEAWSTSQDIADSHYRPGSFTTFYGFEWTPDLDHYVVVYKDRTGKPFDHVRFPDYAGLARQLEQQNVDVLTIPHVSWPFARHIIWDNSVNDSFRRVGEIYSLWNSRHLVQPDDEPQLFELGAANPWSYQSAWSKGLRIGVIGSSDNHLGQPGSNNYTTYRPHSGGLAGVIASINDREHIWSSLKARSTYATTGTPIYLHFEGDGTIMGGEYETASPPRLTGRVAGTNKLASIEIVRMQNGRFATIYSAQPSSETHEFLFIDKTFDREAMYYLRVRQIEEYPGRLYSHSTAEMAWSSPIWIRRAR